MKLIIVISALMMAALPAPAENQGNSQKNGTDILHYSARETFVAEPGATVQGQVYLTRKEQGKSQKQTADISLRQLQAGGSYLLFALIGQTNDYTYLTSFDADAKGRVSLRFRSQGNGQSLGKGKLPLNELMNPTTGLAELVVFTAATQAVARAEFASPDKLSYLVKRDLSEADIASSLRLKANHRNARLKMVVSGIVPTGDYLLDLNGTIVEQVTSNENGKLVINRVFEDPYEALALRSIYLNDSATNAVVGTKLP